MAIELLYVDEGVLDWLSVHKSNMSMADIGTDPRLGYKEFKVIAACGLTLKQIHVVLLSYFCGKTERDIGEIMRIDRSTVNEHLLYAKKKMFKKLKKIPNIR